MAFNPSPTVAAARDFGTKFGADMVIILHINSETGKIGYVSWGQTPELCKLTKVCADTAFDAVIKEAKERGEA